MPIPASVSSFVRRQDPARVRIENPQHVPCLLFAGERVPIEAEGLRQLLGLVSLQATIDELWRRERAGTLGPFWGERPGAIERMVLTPDFHRGAGIPVGTVFDARGFVLPGAIGNDVGCGMRLLATDVTREALLAVRPRLEQRLRAIFFGGERDIPLSPRQREAVLREGLAGLHRCREDNRDRGLWALYDPRREAEELERVHLGGALATRASFSFADYIRASGASDGRDPQIGSVGGGNHFVELQAVEEVVDGPTAHAWGLKREQVTVMVHTGSVGLGHAVGSHFRDVARGLHPAAAPRPAHGFHLLPTWGPHADPAARYLDAMRNAANFAFANRLFLGLMAVRALGEALGRRVEARLVGDAPHNLVWETGEGRLRHRKGACPALGAEPERPGPFRYTGHPVMVPGSMGDSSFVLAGQGSQEALESASHGAGRSLSRGKALHAEVGEPGPPLRVVTPIDPEAPLLRTRRDVLAKYRQRLREEAPHAYKAVGPVIETLEDAGIARRVVRTWPLVTVKG